MQRLTLQTVGEITSRRPSCHPPQGWVAAALSAATETRTLKTRPWHSVVRPGEGLGCLSPLRWRCKCRGSPELDTCEGTRRARLHQPSLPAGPAPGCSLPAPHSPHLLQEGHVRQFDNRQRSLKVANTSLFCCLPKRVVQGKIPPANADASVLRWHVRSGLPCNELRHSTPGTGSPLWLTEDRV